jgi:hypothetical protein
MRAIRFATNQVARSASQIADEVFNVSFGASADQNEL